MIDIIAWTLVAVILVLLVLAGGTLHRRRRDRQRRERGCVLLDLLAAIASLLMLAVAFALQLDRFHFNAGWIANVKPDGRFELRRQPGGVSYADQGEDPPGVLRGRVYCTNGLVPVAADYRTVACARPR